MVNKNRVDIRINNPQLINLLEKYKILHPGISYEGILIKWYDDFSNNGNTLLHEKFQDIEYYMEGYNPNPSLPRIIKLMSQIATFKPILESEKNASIVCTEIEELLIKYMKKWGAKL